MKPYFNVSWDNAPDWAKYHAFAADGVGHWFSWSPVPMLGSFRKFSGGKFQASGHMLKESQWVHLGLFGPMGLLVDWADSVTETPIGKMFDPDWSKAPLWAKYHAFDHNGQGHWYAYLPSPNYHLNVWARGVNDIPVISGYTGQTYIQSSHNVRHRIDCRTEWARSRRTNPVKPRAVNPLKNSTDSGPFFIDISAIPPFFDGNWGPFFGADFGPESPGSPMPLDHPKCRCKLIPKPETDVIMLIDSEGKPKAYKHIPDGQSVVKTKDWEQMVRIRAAVQRAIHTYNNETCAYTSDTVSNILKELLNA